MCGPAVHELTTCGRRGTPFSPLTPCRWGCFTPCRPSWGCGASPARGCGAWYAPVPHAVHQISSAPRGRCTVAPCAVPLVRTHAEAWVLCRVVRRDSEALRDSERRRSVLGQRRGLEATGRRGEAGDSRLRPQQLHNGQGQAEKPWSHETSMRRRVAVRGAEAGRMGASATGAPAYGTWSASDRGRSLSVSEVSQRKLPNLPRRNVESRHRRHFVRHLITCTQNNPHKILRT